MIRPLARPSPKDAERTVPDDKRKPVPRNDKPRNEKPAEQPEPLDEESLEKVMRETPL